MKRPEKRFKKRAKTSENSRFYILGLLSQSSRKLVFTQNRRELFFDFIFVKIDLWIQILLRLEFFEKCLQPF